MKQPSLALNVVLVLAVAVLYYLHFSQKKTVVTKTKPVVSSANVPGMTRPAIAYVELDSLNEKITHFKNRRKVLEGEQKQIELEWENGYKGLEIKKNNFLKKGAAITQEEAQQFQGELMQEQQQIDGKKQSLTQKLSEKSYKFMDDFQQQLRDFLAVYNAEKNYMYIFTTGGGLEYMVYKDSSLNITNDVIEGMNEKMKLVSKE